MTSSPNSSSLTGEILVVDDTPANLTLLRQMLSARGYNVQVCRTGEVAIKSATLMQPDLVLLDIRMPDLDGYDVCRWLKTHPETAEIPVIFISVLETTEEKVAAFQVGGADYVTKPFQAEEVIARVEHQLLVRRQKAQLELEIRERELTEASLTKSRSLLASVLNSTLDSVSALQALRNQDGTIVDFEWLLANAVAATAAETTPEAITGQRLLKLMPEYAAVGLFDDLVRVVETGKILNRELCYESDTLCGWFQAIAIKLDDGVTLTFRDVTARKQMELALKASNVELQQQANLDGLTQVANRRRFDEYLQETWTYCLKHQRPLSLILGDVDRFKMFNDTYGHQTGDVCLQKVAQTLRSLVQYPDDLVARYGGEEFAIILPQTEAAGAIRVARRLQDAIRQIILYPEGDSEPTSVTISLGVSSVTPFSSLPPAALIEAADRALYRAKSEGRDRACWQLVRSLT
ncbi:MAG: diguanylate cyclase [Phormidium sp. BM_Day4_Bin.17]|nr:diguanylate cyclase [Phormidium sp. BM_Day4_Bin.17]UCJ11029.1 MAG: diguanylate cyclase [Phormidium sp. PBR-2020]